MNKIYRLVWNKSLNLWTVVSENARGTTKKRNVNTNISIKTKINSSAVTDQQAQLKPTLIALALSSVFFSTGAFAATNTNGGVVNNSNGSSMAISPTGAQCGTGGQASVNGDNGTAVGCGNNISGTNAGFQQQIVNRRGTTDVGYAPGVPVGDTGGVFGSSTAVGRQNIIRGAGGATTFGSSNVSNSSSNFHNVLMGQGNSTVWTGGYNTLMGIGNQIVDDAAASTDGTGVGTNSIAIGVANRVTGQTSIAFGRQSYADADYSIAQGNVATVQRGATGGIALGFSATVSGKHGVAIGSASGIRNYDPGTSANAAEDSVAVGTRTNASTLESVAIGAGSEVTGTDIGMQQRLADRRSNVAGATNVYPDGRDNVLSRGTAVGQNNKITNRGAGTAIGSNNSITAASDPALAGYNVVIGQGNLASQAYNTGIGIGNDISKGISSTAIGVNNIASGNTGIAMGRGTQALADFAIAQGNTATVAAGATGGIALGNSATTTGVRGIAIGSSTGGAQNDTATAPNAIGMDSIALGTGAKGISNNDIAIGRNAATAAGSGGDNIAMGNSVTTGATGKNIAIGSDGTTANSRTGIGGAVAIGRAQTATGDGAVAIGDPNVVNGDGAVALGKNNRAAGDTAGNTAANGAVALGYENQAIGQGSVALGHTSVAAAAGAIALGDNASAQAVRGIALGSGATAANASDVALGSGSVTDAANPTANGTVGGVTYNYAGTSPSSVVSVGSAGNERQVTNVAAGRVSETSTDAINGSQLYSTQQALGNLAESTANHLGGGSVVNPDGTVSAPNYSVNGNNLSNVGDAITELDKGWNLQSKDVKFDSVTATDADGNETILTAKGVSLKDQVGNTTVLGQDGLGFVDSIGNRIGPRITAGGINAGNTVIGGVAAGRVASDSQDAINGSQLKGVSDSVSNAIGGNTTVNPDGTINTSNIGGTGKDNINDAIGAVGKAAQAAKTTVSKAEGDENITINRSTNADGSTDYKVGLAKDINVDSVTAGGTKVDGDGLHITGGPSVTKAGINAGDNKVTGVADGTVAAGSQDAINGGQLHGVADSVKNVVGGNATVNPDGSITTSNVGGTGQNNINDAINSVRGAAAAAKSTVSNKDGNISVTPTTKADGSKDYEVGLAKDIKVDSVTTANQVNVGGNEGTTIAADGVRIAEGPSMTKAGIDAGRRKVTGVSEGTIAPDSKDAINGSQLHQSYENVGKALGGGAGYDPVSGWTPPNYEVAGGKHDNVGDALNALNNADQALGDRITNLGDQMQQAFYDTNQRIDDVKKHANAGVAAAMALETAPYISGKYTYAVGAAYHGGENAVGVTLRKTADNGRWSLTTGVAAASQGDPSFRIGLSGVFD
ncbi:MULTISPECIES: ESPR-type extended signal peptide-containing protein [Acinetobacter]|uniref:ESPR-type extended signal peptide-containing protein n=1 Tax=Acinetobacter TaxID=469 RepID=UPI000697CEF2|nr:MULTISPECIES: ESPR-type extended signal peptide-containing protein [Acinetobacter]